MSATQYFFPAPAATPSRAPVFAADVKDEPSPVSKMPEFVTISVELQEFMRTVVNPYIPCEFIEKMLENVENAVFNEVLVKGDSDYAGKTLGSILCLYRPKFLLFREAVVKKLDDNSLRVLKNEKLSKTLTEKYPHLNDSKQAISKPAVAKGFHKDPSLELTISFNKPQTFDLKLSVENLKCSITKKIFSKPVLVLKESTGERQIAEECFKEFFTVGERSRVYSFPWLENVIEEVRLKYPVLEDEIFFNEVEFDTCLIQNSDRDKTNLEKMLRQIQASAVVCNTISKIYGTAPICFLANCLEYKPDFIMPQIESIIKHLSREAFNSIQSRGDERLGTSAVYFLARSTVGRLFLLEHPKLVEMIEPKTLCYKVKKNNKSALDYFHENLDIWKKILKKNPSFRFMLLTNEVLLIPKTHKEPFYFYYDVFDEDFKKQETDHKAESKVSLNNQNIALLIIGIAFSGSSTHFSPKDIMCCVEEKRDGLELDPRVKRFLSIALPPDLEVVSGFVRSTAEVLGYDGDALTSNTTNLAHIRNYLSDRYNPLSDKRSIHIGRVDYFIERAYFLLRIAKMVPDKDYSKREKLRLVFIHYVYACYWSSYGVMTPSGCDFIAQELQEKSLRCLIDLEVTRLESFVAQPDTDRNTKCEELFKLLTSLVGCVRDFNLLDATLKSLFSDLPGLLKGQEVRVFKCFMKRMLACLEGSLGGVTEDHIRSLEQHTRISTSAVMPGLFADGPSDSKSIEGQLKTAYQELLREGGFANQSQAVSAAASPLKPA